MAVRADAADHTKALGRLSEVVESRYWRGFVDARHRVADVIQLGHSRVGGVVMNDKPEDFASGAAAMAELTNMIVDQIRKLAALHEEGILTDEEFSAKKTELLSRL